MSPPPEPFSGDIEKTKGFLLQRKLAFTRSPQTFSTDTQKICYIIGLLRGKTLRCTEAFFDESSVEEQGNRSVVDFAVEFRMLAEESGWNDSALKGAFYHALNERVKDDLAGKDRPESLD